MADEGFKRKLTAILSADVAGYSRLMAEDETLTVKTIAAYREVIASLIKQHRGRVVDSPGDNVLSEFSSVVDAVQCAVAVQNEIQTRNAELPDNRKTSETSLMKKTVSTVMGSTLQPGWRRWQIPVAYAFRRRLLIKLRPNCLWVMNIWANSQLKIYPSRWVPIGS